MKRKADPLFKTEADLCAAFIAWAKPKGWTAYAETSGWDILMVRDDDGTQLGIQAKLQSNLHVINQTLPQAWEWTSAGPDFRAILVPDNGLETVCGALGIGVIYPEVRVSGYDGRSFLRGFTSQSRSHEPLPSKTPSQQWHFWNPERRHKLPEYVPDVVAGASGPVQLTKWKIAALKVCALLEVQGYVTRKDIRSYGIDDRRWTGALDNWLLPGSTAGQWVRGPGLRIEQQHPEVYPKVLADVRAALTKAA